MNQLNLTTTCNELNWIAKKAQYTCDNSFEGESWSEFIFWGRINEKMMKVVKLFLKDKSINTGIYKVNGVEIIIEFSHGKDHFRFMRGMEQ